jgi:hypothetical protein
MGSVNHPKLYDPHVITTLKAAFHDVWTVVDASDQPRAAAEDHQLKAEIIRKLLELVSTGTTDQAELRAEVLRQLPMASPGPR